MWTSGNLVAPGLFLFATAFLWLAAAVVFGIAGLVAVVSFAAGQSQLDAGFADFGVQINLWMHILGSAAVVAIVLVPVAHDWVTRRDLLARLASASTGPIATIGASIS